MAFTPTPEQRAAIETIDRDVAVTAGAGSGKTKVLVERYLHLLRNGYDIDDIVAITFTKKAAQEMKGRIRQAAAADPALADLQDRIYEAQISTIHSFCQRLISENPEAAEVDPRFRVMEQWEADTLLSAVSEDTLGEALFIDPSGLTDLAAEHRFLSDFAARLVQIYRQIRSTSEFSICAEPPVVEPATLENCCQELLEALSLFREFCRSQKLSPTQQELCDQLDNYLLQIRADLTSGSPGQMSAALELLADLFKGVRGKIKEQAELVTVKLSEAQQKVLDLMGAEYLAALQGVLAKIHQRYTAEKRRRGVLDFADLEAIAARLLAKAPAQRIYYRQVMVDEFQDTNSLQKVIIDRLQEKGARIFVVGDAKQSIYRFRGADVSVFLQIQQEIAARGGRVIHLRDNFRSRQGVVDFANEFFGQIMAGDDVSIEPSRGHRPNISTPGVELITIPQQEDERMEERRQREAHLIATYVADLVSNGDYQYSDITILLRAMSNARLYEQALQQAGIPFVNLSGRGFYARQEIKDVTSFIDWLLDPADRLAEAVVLSSPFGQLDDQSLFWYIIGREQNLTPAQQNRLAELRELVRRLRLQAKYLPAPQLIEEIFHRTGYKERIATQPAGSQMVANVEKLQRKSWELWSQGIVSIYEQARFIRTMMETDSEEGEARLDAENANAVKIMTIHAAKGLEFPVVLLADLAAAVSRTESRNLLGHHPQMGLAFRQTSLYQEIVERHKLEEHLEAKRLLYVATTRAADKLVFCGVGDPPDSGPDLKEQKCWWEWLGSCLPRLSPGLVQRRTLDIEPGYSAVSPTEERRLAILSPPIVKMPPPMGDDLTFSATSLMVYAQCPRRYYFRYVLHAPEVVIAGDHSTGNSPSSRLAPLARGNIVHRVCARIEQPKDKEELLVWAAAMEGVHLNPGDYAELEQIIDRYLKSPFFAYVRQQNVEREMEFAVPLERKYIITGTIDQLITTDHHEMIIADLKTNWVSSAEYITEAAQYDWQLRIYAWAISKMLARAVDQTQLYFLIPDRVFVHPDAPTTTAETEAWLQKTCRHIQDSAYRGMSAFPPARQCRGCGYACRELSFEEEQYEQK